MRDQPPTRLDEALLEAGQRPGVDPSWQVTLWQIDVQQPNETPFSAGAILQVDSVETDFLTATFDLVCEGYTLGTLVPKRRYNSTSGFVNLPRHG